LADRVLRPTSARAAAGQLRRHGRRSRGVSTTDRTLLHLGALAARPAPGPVVALVAARLRRETGSLVYPAERRPFSGTAWPVVGAGRRPNLNLLGEAILGWQERERRVAARRLSARDATMSTASRSRWSSVAAGLSLIDFEGSVSRNHRDPCATSTAAPETRERAEPKLVNLDMGSTGISISRWSASQGSTKTSSPRAPPYCIAGLSPDTQRRLDRLLEWAQRRRRRWRPIRIRW